MTIYSYYGDFYLSESGDIAKFKELHPKYENKTLAGDEVQQWANLVNKIWEGRHARGADYQPSNPLPCCLNLTNLMGTVGGVAIVVGAIFLFAALALGLGALWMGIGTTLAVVGAVGVGIHAYQNLYTVSEQ